METNKKQYSDYRDYLQVNFFQPEIIALMADPDFQEGLAKMLNACDQHGIRIQHADFLDAIKLMDYHGF